MHNPILLTAICAVVSFFIGAIPFGLIFARIFCKTDVQNHGRTWRGSLLWTPTGRKSCGKEDFAAAEV